jgi:CubicO group peptidase (beta-lactamase class C family)
LDIPVRKYIPWFQVGDTDMSGRITVRQLLNQNSGFSTLDGRNNFADSDSTDFALEKIVRGLHNIKLNSIPGTHWEYSNINYAILGYLIQEVSGEPYDQYMDHHVFGPLGMHDSKASDQQINKNLMATGYRYWFGKAIPAYGLPYPTSMAPAGYLFTNADDMGRYLMAQLNGGVAGGVSVVSSEGIDTLHRSGVPAFGKNRYAMGWFFNSANPNFFDHSGGLPNFFSQMAIDTKDGWGVALLVNANNMLSGPDVIAIGPQVENILRGRKPTEIKKAPFFVPALIELTGLLIVQLLITFWMVRRTDRWATNPENSPKSKAGWIMNATFPVVIGLILATFLTIVIPKVNGGNLSGLVLFAPDAGLLLLANICVALSGGIVCTYFVAKHYFVKDIKT